MPKNDEPKRRGRRDTAATTKIAASCDTDADGTFFVELQNDFEQLVATPDILLNIPCWGWIGAGKTCSLLTAVQFCELTEHGVSLARVKDTDELVGLEERHDTYRGLGLIAIAEATIARLNELNQVFFEDNKWPPGTENASFYLFEVRTQKGRVAYVLLPDLRGGSFQQPDAASRTVSASAHAFIVMVDPEKFTASTPTGKEYKEDVIGRLQRCANERIPTCIMISRTDKYSKNPSLVDRTHKELTALSAKLDFKCRIFRVSVLGASPPSDDAPLELSKRRPQQLVQAWVWALHSALTRNREELVQNVPVTNLADGARLRAPKATAIREMRLSRDEQKGAGQVMCPIPSAQNPTFLFLDSTGALSEVALASDGTPSLKVQSKLANEIDLKTVAASLRDGTLFLSEAPTGTAMWVGPPGGAFQKTELPYPLHAWSALSDSMICGVDASGTLHVLRLSGDKWKPIDYFSNFSKPTPHMVFSELPSENAVIACSGESVAAIKVDGKGKLAEQLNMAVAVRYAQGPAALNRAGYVVGRGASNELIFGRDKAHQIGTINPSAPVIALAQDAPVIAWVSAENVILAAALIDAKIVQTDAETATKVPEPPQRMCWDASGHVLVVTYPSARWAIFRRLGF